MFGTNVKRIKKDDYFSPKFKIAYDFLQETDLDALETGTVQFADGIYAMISSYITLPAIERKFETHDKYFDLQFVISGQESIGLADRAALKVSIPYEPIKDVTFYEEPVYSGAVGLSAGDFIVIAPEEAHKPHCDMDGEHPVKKIVFKIPV